MSIAKGGRDCSSAPSSRGRRLRSFRTLPSSPSSPPPSSPPSQPSPLSPTSPSPPPAQSSLSQEWLRAWWWSFGPLSRASCPLSGVFLSFGPWSPKSWSSRSLSSSPSLWPSLSMIISSSSSPYRRGRDHFSPATQSTLWWRTSLEEVAHLHSRWNLRGCCGCFLFVINLNNLSEAYTICRWLWGCWSSWSPSPPTSSTSPRTRPRAEGLDTDSPGSSKWYCQKTDPSLVNCNFVHLFQSLRPNKDVNKILLCCSAFSASIDSIIRKASLLIWGHVKMGTCPYSGTKNCTWGARTKRPPL